MAESPSPTPPNKSKDPEKESIRRNKSDTFANGNAGMRRNKSDSSLRLHTHKEIHLRGTVDACMSGEDVVFNKKNFYISPDYDYMKSTEDNYADDSAEFVGRFKKDRAELDYTFHKKYRVERQLFQDALIENFLATIVKDKDTNMTCDHPLENWIVFTAGAMGAGKGRTMQWLTDSGLFPMDAFVNVDPDILRGMLPEMEGYNEVDALNMGWRTQKEVGYISELLTHRALDSKKNVLVDGSLRDKHWYHVYFCSLRARFPILKIAILHVTAKKETVLARAKKRAITTGRTVPPQAILHSMEEIPKSLEVLSPVTDLIVNFENENSSTPLMLDCTMRTFTPDTPNGRVVWTIKMAPLLDECMREREQMCIPSPVYPVNVEQQLSVPSVPSEIYPIHGNFLVTEKSMSNKGSSTSSSKWSSISDNEESIKSTVKLRPSFVFHDVESDQFMSTDDWGTDFQQIWLMKCEEPAATFQRMSSMRSTKQPIVQRAPFGKATTIRMDFTDLLSLESQVGYGTPSDGEDSTAGEISPMRKSSFADSVPPFADSPSSPKDGDLPIIARDLPTIAEEIPIIAHTPIIGSDVHIDNKIDKQSSPSARARNKNSIGIMDNNRGSRDGDENRDKDMKDKKDKGKCDVS